MMFYHRVIEDGSTCITGYKGNDAHVDIPNNINATVLFDDLFKGHTELISVSIPDTITQIGGFVFDGCTNLKSITLPPMLEGMWQYAMTRCGVESITIPGSVGSIIPFTFFKCEALKTVVFTEGTESISAWAFKDCTALRDVYLPKSLKNISDKAFEGCQEITFHTVDFESL